MRSWSRARAERRSWRQRRCILPSSKWDLTSRCLLRPEPRGAGPPRRDDRAMYTPSLDEVRALAAEGRGNLVPVFLDVSADLETPVSAYLKVARGRHSFLLESVEGGERLARYSFIGTEPYRIIRTGPGESPHGATDPLTLIEEELKRFELIPIPGLPPFHGGAVGYLAYEVARYFEHLPAPDVDAIGLPESVFLFTDSLLIFDHLRHSI